MFEDFGHDENPHALDPVEANAREGIREFFNTNRQRVFFSRQLEVQLRIVSFIGVEVKNTLGYMDRIESRQKIRLCTHLNLRPVFAVRRNCELFSEFTNGKY